MKLSTLHNLVSLENFKGRQIRIHNEYCGSLFQRMICKSNHSSLVIQLCPVFTLDAADEESVLTNLQNIHLELEELTRKLSPRCVDICGLAISII